MEEASSKNKIREFNDLFAWQKAHALVIFIYSLCKTFPENEKFGLVSQLQRASVSITSNIAEGFGRKEGKEKLQFYRIAHGSLTEVKSLSFTIRDTKIISEEEYLHLENLLRESQATLLGLIKATQA